MLNLFNLPYLLASTENLHAYKENQSLQIVSLSLTRQLGTILIAIVVIVVCAGVEATVEDFQVNVGVEAVVEDFRVSIGVESAVENFRVNVGVKAAVANIVEAAVEDFRMSVGVETAVEALQLAIGTSKATQSQGALLYPAQPYDSPADRHFINVRIYSYGFFKEYILYDLHALARRTIACMI
ncbi:hypothetical protein CHS0354_013265 [Potamilus streckersoni]|uniref:Uncharacterized protein n=1 Tax=Potamilus streckersoni TaxID=2493646 RepID=A0AAE0SMF7_9BIVA|nr:hypothetical protein CHS0354_013265 [Potamilus streckersoni]